MAFYPPSKKKPPGHTNLRVLVVSERSANLLDADPIAVVTFSYEMPVMLEVTPNSRQNLPGSVAHYGATRYLRETWSVSATTERHIEYLRQAFDPEIVSDAEFTRLLAAVFSHEQEYLELVARRAFDTLRET